MSRGEIHNVKIFSDGLSHSVNFSYRKAGQSHLLLIFALKHREHFVLRCVAPATFATSRGSHLTDILAISCRVLVTYQLFSDFETLHRLVCRPAGFEGRKSSY